MQGAQAALILTLTASDIDLTFLIHLFQGLDLEAFKAAKRNQKLGCLHFVLWISGHSHPH